jgi:hypothetical protein
MNFKLKSRKSSKKKKTSKMLKLNKLDGGSLEAKLSHYGYPRKHNKYYSLIRTHKNWI